MHRREEWTLGPPECENLQNQLGLGLRLFRHSGAGIEVELGRARQNRPTSLNLGAHWVAG